MARLRDNDEEVLEAFYKHSPLSKEDYEDLEQNYPENIKSFKRRKFIFGREITEKGKRAFEER